MTHGRPRPVDPSFVPHHRAPDRDDDWIPDDVEYRAQLGGRDLRHQDAHSRRRGGRSDARSLRPVPLRQLVAGTVVVAHVEFGDGSGWKTRPAVVLEAGSHDVQVMPVSTADGARRRPGVDVIPDRGNGMNRAGRVVPRIVTIDRGTDLVDRLGELDDATCAAVLALAEHVRLAPPQRGGYLPAAQHDASADCPACRPMLALDDSLDATAAPVE